MRRLRSGLAGLLLCAGVSCALVAGVGVGPAAAVDAPWNYVIDDPIPGGNTNFLVDNNGVSGYVAKAGKGVKPFMRLAGPVGWAFTAGSAAWWAYSETDGFTDWGFGDAPDSLEDWCAQGYCGSAAYTPEASGNGSHVTVVGVAPSATYKLEVVIECLAPFTGTINGTTVYSCGSSYGDYRPYSSNPLPGLIECRTNSTGNTTLRQAGFSYNMPNSPPWTATMTPTLCSSGETIIGYRQPSNPSFGGGRGQPYGIGWGTLATPDAEIGWGGAEVEIDCKNSSTGQVVHLSGSGSLDDDGRILIPSCKQHLGPEWYGTGLDVTPTDPYWDDPGTPVEHDPIPEDWLTPIPGLSADDVVPSEYQQDCNNTARGCSLSVVVDGNPCAIGEPLCTVWEEIAAGDPNRVACMWGAMELPVAMCAPLALAYVPGTSVPIDPEPVPPDTDPYAPPGTTTGVNPTDPDLGECLADAWGWNPVDWVAVPVKCVLSWAFIPETPPPFDDIPSPVPPGWIPDLGLFTDGACGPLAIPALDFGNIIGQIGPTTFANTCDAPWPVVRSLTYYGLLAGSLVGVGLAAYRSVMTSVGMGVQGGDV